jgi:chromate reductase
MGYQERFKIELRALVRVHLRQVLVYLNMPALQQPEFYLAQAADKFNAQGELTDAETRQKIQKLWAAFVQWINKTR